MINRESLGHHWPIRPLGDLCEFLDNLRRPVTESDRTAGPYPYYGANGQQGTINDYIFDEPLVLLAEDGGYFGDPSRSIAYRIAGKTWVNNHAHVLRPKNGMQIGYLCRVLEHYDVTPYVTGTTRGKLTKAGASAIQIPLPPLEEQRRIATILDKADVVRQKRRATIQKLDSLTQSLFLEMFSEPNFERIRLGKLADIQTGGTPSRAERHNYGGRIPWVKTTEVAGGLIESTEECLTESGLKNSNCKIFPKGSIVIAMYGQGRTRGQSAILGIDAATNQACAVLIPNERFVTSFMFNQIQLNYDELRSLGRGGNQPNLNLSLVRDFEVILPSIGDQRLFEARNSLIGRTKNRAIASLDMINQLSNSLQFRAFRGEL